MKKMLLLSLVLVGCFEFPSGLQEQLDDLATEEEVFWVNCEPKLFELAINQTGSCDALNADSTLLDPNAVVWSSSIPDGIVVTTSGELEANNFVSDNVVITAGGANRTFAFEALETF